MTPSWALDRIYAGRARIIPSTPDEPDIGLDTIQMTFGHPDPALFPVPELISALSAVLTTSANEALQYTNFRGTDRLLEILLARLTRSLNLSLDRSNLIVTNGSMQVLQLMSHVFLDPGDLVLTESPTYFRGVTIFQSYGAHVRGIPIDEHGLRTDVLAEVLREQARVGILPKFLYIMPSYQNPSGVTLSIERRLEILGLSSTYGFAILEDTAYNDLWFDTPPPTSLFELDKNAGHVVQMGTFSKTIAPGLAVGWALGPAPVVMRFVEFKANGGTTPLTSSIAAALLESDRFDEHVAQLRHAYRDKRDAMIGALNQTVIEHGHWISPGGGYFVWMRLADHVDRAALSRHALDEGVIFLPGEFCYPDAQAASQEIRLAFSALSTAAISEGITRLSRAIHRSIVRN